MFCNADQKGLTYNSSRISAPAPEDTSNAINEFKILKMFIKNAVFLLDLFFMIWDLRIN